MDIVCSAQHRSLVLITPINILYRIYIMILLSTYSGSESCCTKSKTQKSDKFHFIKNQLMHLLKKTLSYIHIKNTKNLLKKCSVKGAIKPYMFRSLFHDHPQGSSFVLSAPTTYQPPALSFVFFRFVAICPLFVYVSGVPVCVLSGRETTRQHTRDNMNGEKVKTKKW
jgi:hypothetical protein